MGAYDKQSVPKIKNFPTDGTDRQIGVDLLGCTGILVPAAPSTDSDLVIESGGEQVTLTFYSEGSTDGSTEYPCIIELQVDKIIDSGTTDDFEDGIELLTGGA